MKITGNNSNPFAKEAQDGKTVKEQTLNENSKTQAGKTASSSAPILKSTLLADEIKAKLNDTPAVNADKVAEMKALIAKGEYKIDFQGLAAKMIEEAQQEESYTNS